jgi:hypothetical protein
MIKHIYKIAVLVMFVAGFLFVVSKDSALARGGDSGSGGGGSGGGSGSSGTKPPDVTVKVEDSAPTSLPDVQNFSNANSNTPEQSNSSTTSIDIKPSATTSVVLISPQFTSITTKPKKKTTSPIVSLPPGSKVKANGLQSAVGGRAFARAIRSITGNTFVIEREAAGYKVTVHPNTIIVDVHGKKIAYSALKVGHMVTIVGTFTPQNTDALYVKDWSI